MLVLTRGIGKKIIIGNDVVVTIIGIDYKRGQVSIGIEAPDDVSIHREEVFDRIKAGETLEQSRARKNGNS